MDQNNRFGKKKMMILFVLGLAALATVIGVAQAGMGSIQLNSPASFPVDI